MGDTEHDGGTVVKSLRTEQQELRTASYILNEELIATLLNDNLNFYEEKGPSYNKDMYDRHYAVKDDPDFPEGVEIQIGDTDTMLVNEAHSLYKRTTLQIPVSKKYLRIDYVKVNPAYIFPEGEDLKFFTAKEVELHRYNKAFGEVNTTFSAFDSAKEELNMTEMLKLEFDGYNYEFKKMINRNQEYKVFLEIGQWNKESKSMKILRKSNEVSNLKGEHFDGIRNMSFKAIERAKKISNIGK